MIGVLFAANRSERPFDPDDVSLLVTLAMHAAVALDKAHLLSETNEALDELNTASKQPREHTEGLERASDAHDRFTNLVLRGGDVKDVAAAAAEVLRGDLRVLDTEDRTLTTTVGPSGSPNIDVRILDGGCRHRGSNSAARGLVGGLRDGRA